MILIPEVIDVQIMLIKLLLFQCVGGSKEKTGLYGS